MGHNAAIAEDRARALFPRAYVGYAYAYPHKSAYEHLEPAVPLREAWRDETGGRIALYMHVPFCGMRCGFCNLFTTPNPKPPLVRRYLDALTTQAEIAREELGGAVTVGQFVIGGGTPTFLDVRDLERLFDLAAEGFGADPRHIPASIETSPGTASAERIALLAERGVARISIGAQSFFEHERYAMGRPQKHAHLETALDTIRAHNFPVLNIDLIYGASSQTPDSLRKSLRRALLWRPEELYLYPLYVRPQTGLGGKVETWGAHRLGLYRAGRDFLLGEGYEQLSMRCFRRPDAEARGRLPEFADADCAMLGLGAGARSATRHLHYSTQYAVERKSVLALLEAYCATPREEFRLARHGIRLDADERLRGHVVHSILLGDGMDIAHFLALSGAETVRAFAPLAALMDSGLAEEVDGRLKPTAAGLELSDAIGPWLYSPRVAERLTRHEVV